MKKQILIENDLIFGGGVEKIMYNIATYLDRNNYKVTITTSRGYEEDFYQYYPKSIKFISQEYFKWICYRKYSPKWFLQAAKYIFNEVYRNIIRYKKYDIAIAIKEGPSALKISKCRAKQHFAWIHVDYNFMHWTKYLYNSDESERLFLENSFDRVICVSEAVKNSVLDKIGNINNICVRYNPINYTDIINKSLQQCPITRNPNKMLFVSIGRLDPIKQYDVLIETCANLHLKYDFELWIIGEGPERKKLEDIIKKRNATFIKLLGNQDNPYTFLKQADCFISTSKVESYSLAIQEALILCIPILALQFPALNEGLDSRFGISIPNDDNSLENALEDIFNQPNILGKIRENIKREFNPNDLWEKRLNDIINLWEIRREE